MPGESHGLKSLSGYSSKVSKTKRLSLYACTIVTIGAAIVQPKSVQVSTQKSKEREDSGQLAGFSSLPTRCEND